MDVKAHSLWNVTCGAGSGIDVADGLEFGSLIAREIDLPLLEAASDPTPVIGER